MLAVNELGSAGAVRGVGGVGGVAAGVGVDLDDPAIGL